MLSYTTNYLRDTQVLSFGYGAQLFALEEVQCASFVGRESVPLQASLRTVRKQKLDALNHKQLKKGHYG